MLTIALATLVTVVALASIVSLTDSALKWRNAYRAMKREMALDCLADISVTEAAVVTLRPIATDLKPVNQPFVSVPLANAA